MKAHLKLHLPASLLMFFGYVLRTVAFETPQRGVSAAVTPQPRRTLQRWVPRPKALKDHYKPPMNLWLSGASRWPGCCSLPQPILALVIHCSLEQHGPRANQLSGRYGSGQFL